MIMTKLSWLWLYLELLQTYKLSNIKNKDSNLCFWNEQLLKIVYIFISFVGKNKKLNKNMFQSIIYVQIHTLCFQ